MRSFKGDIESKHIAKYSLLKVFQLQKIKEDSEINHTTQILLNIDYVYKAPYKTNHERRVTRCDDIVRPSIYM